ncbi:MAG: MBL fold metallo-hydrolase [Melioribacteraceae bacterium]|nr:MBL fold metallo-hydrolase [Melioribacteraceae bacterium]
MRVFKLNTNPGLYSSNVYLALGNWATIEDRNVLIDTGIDDYIMKSLDEIYTGVGKKSVDKVILTHNHFDHTGGLKYIIKKYKPEVIGFNNAVYVTKTVEDQSQVKIGDEYFTVYHMPSHSYDSIVLYNHEHKVLFSGDTNFDIKNSDGSFSQLFVNNFEALAKKGVNIIYPGHGNIITENVDKILLNSMNKLNSSMITNKETV